MSSVNLRDPINTPPPITEEEIFQTAVALPQAERAGYLAQACMNQPESLARIERLLGSHEPNAFVQRPGASLLAREMTRLRPEEAGECIGPYKLLEQIGEGGFAVVWMAEQEKPVRRRVALKVIKLGMDTKEVIARFDQERQALALMDHPNISRVVGAGATPFGRPFFVMDLVRGIKITDYCDQANLAISERLQLFVTVCRAVQHAHQKGIIHRDLKPSNILVTLQDGVAVPKVIDFGVAKATQQRLTDLTLFTQFQQMIGTPLYMSPEQAEMSGLDIDTRSDIYALGVLLYELLSGQTPFNPDAFMKAGYDEMRRLIREQEPLTPSTALQALGADARGRVARNRQSDAAKLASLVRGDLDSIVMKALEKDRTRRYDTANGLAMDIQRHLAHEPVLARPASRAYRLRRMVRRNKGAVVASATIVAALIIGFVASVWQARRANQLAFRAQRAEQAQSQLRSEAEASARAAHAAAKKSEQIATFLREMLAGVHPWEAVGRDTSLLRDILDTTVVRLGRELRDQPAVQAELLLTVSDVFKSLGEFAKAEEQCREALRLLRQASANDDLAVARTLNSLGGILQFQNKREAAEKLFREELEIAQRAEVPAGFCTANALWSLGSVLTGPEAEMLLHQALAQFETFEGSSGPSVIEVTSALGHAHERRGDLAGAEPFLRDALAMRRQSDGPDDPRTCIEIMYLAHNFDRRGMLAEAEPLYREALTLAPRFLSAGHFLRKEWTLELSTLLRKRGQIDEADRLLRPATVQAADAPPPSSRVKHLAIVRAANPREPGKWVPAFSDLASELRQARRFVELEAIFAEVLTPQVAQMAEARPLLELRASQRGRRGQFAEAAEEFQRLIEMEPSDHEQWPRAAMALLASDDLERYRELCHKALERFGRTKDPNTAERIAKMCVALPDSGVDLKAVAQLADIAIAAGSTHRHFDFFMVTRALVDYRQGTFTRAIEWLGRIPGDVPCRDVHARAILAMAHHRMGQDLAARSALEAGRGLMPAGYPHPETGDLGGVWHDWIIADFLLREAQELIGN